jgi:transposase
MNKSNELLDFSDTSIFCGLDVHLKSWRVNIRDADMELRDFTQNPDAALLQQFLIKNYPKATYKVGYEAGFCGFNIQRQFKGLGIDCVVLNAADIPKGDKDKRQKNDKRDARAISQELKNKKDVGIHIPAACMEYARSLVRTRSQLVLDSTRQKCRIWHRLHFHGLELPQKKEVGQYWSRKFIDKLQSYSCHNDQWLKLDMEILIKDHLQKRALLLETLRAIRALCRTTSFASTIKLLLSIPGIGEVNAAVILFEIENIHRFKTPDNLYAYAGLIPDTNDSGETKRSRGITHRKNSRLLKALIESSWITIRIDPALLMKYKTYCKRMASNKAIVRIAKHLLARIRYVLKEQKPYVLAVVK